MNELDALEKELAAMRPRQPSAELKLRLAASLESAVARRATSTPRVVGRRVAILGGLLAACLVAIAAWPGKGSPLDAETNDVPHELRLATTFDPDAPSVWSYRKTLIRSPELLDVALDRHAIAARQSNPGAPLHAFVRLDSKTNAILGEL